MINEWEEFCAYTGTVSYTASRKSDTTYLGRFTFVTILEFEGMARILTILARGYLFHDKSGAVALGDPRDPDRLRPPGALRLVQRSGAGQNSTQGRMAVQDGLFGTAPGVPGAGGCGRDRLVSPPCPGRRGFHADASGEGAKHVAQKCGDHSSQVCRRVAKQSNAVSDPNFFVPDQGGLDAAL